jgi:hypothetical protein
MDTELTNLKNEPGDGDWCLVNLSDDLTEEATKVAHTIGVDFCTFMCMALEEKLSKMRHDPELKDALKTVGWQPMLK